MTDDTPESAGVGDYVHVASDAYRGFGIVRGLYHDALVDNVAEDVRGTPDDPAAKVERAYFFEGHLVLTGRHVGVVVSKLTKIDPLPTTRDPETLAGRLVARRLEALNAHGGLAGMVQSELHKRLGGVNGHVSRSRC